MSDSVWRRSSKLKFSTLQEGVEPYMRLCALNLLAGNPQPAAQPREVMPVITSIPATRR
jgi:hypothetical protein